MARTLPQALARPHDATGWHTPGDSGNFGRMLLRLAQVAAVLLVAAALGSCEQPPVSDQQRATEPEAPGIAEPEPEGVCVPDVPAPRLLRLSPLWHAHTMAALFDEAPAAPTLPAPTGEVISELEVEALESAARAFVARGGHLRFLPCDVDAAFDETCARSFVDAFGLYAFRRPLEDEERQRLVAYVNGLHANPAFDPPLSFRELIDAVAQVIAQSPQLIYLLDEGVPDPQLQEGWLRTTGFSRAARLSYALTDQPPSGELLEAADRGELDSDEGLRAHAAALVDTPAGRQRIRRFASSWLGLDGSSRQPHLEDRPKNPETFPIDSPALRAAMRNEVESLYERVFFEGGGVAALMTSRAAHVNASLASLYGVSGPPSDDAFEWVELDASQRAGMLTRAAWLAQHAGPAHSSPIQRGVHVLRKVLCHPLGDPPPNVNEVPPLQPQEGELITTRREAELRTGAPACSGCHGLVNPVGFALEGYDALGGFRVTEPVMTEQGLVDVAIDDSAELRAGDLEGWVHGAIDLSERLAASEAARDCHAILWFEQAISRAATEQDRCELERLQRAFRASDDLGLLLIDAATSAPLKLMREPEE